MSFQNKLSPFRYRRDADVIADQDNLRLWKHKLVADPDAARRIAHNIAIQARLRDKLDPFIFKRTYAALINATAAPDDFQRRGRGR